MRTGGSYGQEAPAGVLWHRWPRGTQPLMGGEGRGEGPRAHCSPSREPRAVTLSWSFPPPVPTWPVHPAHGCEERGDHLTSLSPVIQQCRGRARTRPAGSYPELLFANWRKCSGVCDNKTWKPKPKQNKNQKKKKNTKVESKFLKFTKNCENFRHMMFEYQTQRFLKL